MKYLGTRSLVLLLQVMCTLCQDMKNITITVPNGTSRHGDSNLLCTPITSYQILTFYVVNYFSHAATLRARPGEGWLIMFISVGFALLLPFSGLYRGVSGILHRTTLRRGALAATDLQKAVWAGALCAVARSNEWKPYMTKWPLQGVCIETKQPPEAKAMTATEPFDHHHKSKPLDATVELRNSFGGTLFQKSHNVYGIYHLPPGYCFVILPPYAKVGPEAREDSALSTNGPHIALSSSLNIPAAMIAIAQIIFATMTLYDTRGNQIEKFGYAAFGLTVIPYVVMSFVNLTATLLTPTYPSLYMVRSVEMEEAEANGGKFQGTVGAIYQSAKSDENRQDKSAIVDDTGDLIIFSHVPKHVPRHKNHSGEHRFRIIDKRGRDGIRIIVPRLSPFQGTSFQFGDDLFETLIVLCGIWLLATIAPFLLINAMTSFDPGDSTGAQQGWTMAWLVFGIVLGSLLWPMYVSEQNSDEDKRFSSGSASTVVLAILFGPPAVGGFLVVRDMLKSFGYCTRIGA